MSRSLDTLLRPSLLALAIALCTPLASSQLIAAEQASSVRAYNLPAAPLASTLNQIASQAGLALSLNPSLAAGKTSAPVQGQFDAAGALREALRGTGLQLEQSSAGTYSLVAVPEGVMALPATSVIGVEAALKAPGARCKGIWPSAPPPGPRPTPRWSKYRARSRSPPASRWTTAPYRTSTTPCATCPASSPAATAATPAPTGCSVRGFEPTQFLDGLPLPKGAYATPKMETWNLERVALLRGPASSVYGQTPPGGLLDMVSRRPCSNASNEVQLQVGSDERKQINFDSTGPIDDEGQFLYRVSGVVRDSNTSHRPHRRQALQHRSQPDLEHRRRHQADFPQPVHP